MSASPHRYVKWLPVAALAAASAVAQPYPSQPIRVVTGNAGGALDLTVRMMAQGLNGPLGQQFVIDNRLSAGGALAVTAVTKAKPDGHTLLMYGSNIWLFQYMTDNVPWDTLRDLAPIALVVKSPSVLAVHPTLPVKSVSDLVALARARPGELNEAGIGSGNATHMASELFKRMAGINMLRVPYKGGAPALNALIGGEVQLTFSVAGAVIPHLKTSRLRALAITSPQPSPLIPGLVTVAASGLPGYDAESLYGLFAPAGTPPAIITRLNQEAVKYLSLPETKERFLNAGLEAAGSSPEQLVATIKADMAKWGKLIREAGIRE